MASPKPKALQTLAGKPLIVHLLDALSKTGISDVVIVHSSKADVEFKKEIKNDQNIAYVEQKQAIGTAHALQTALPHVSNEHLLVLLGDVPLLSTNNIIKLRDQLIRKNVFEKKLRIWI